MNNPDLTDSALLSSQSFVSITSVDGLKADSAGLALKPLISATYNSAESFTYVISNDAQPRERKYQFAVGTYSPTRATVRPRVPRCTTTAIDIQSVDSGLMRSRTWAALPATVSDLWMERVITSSDAQSLFDDALADLSDISFSILVMARPIFTPEFVKLRSRVLSRRQEDIKRLRSRNGTDQVEEVEERLAVDKLNRWITMLERGRNLGLWRVRLLVGANDPGNIARVAGGLSAAFASGPVLLSASHGELSSGNIFESTVPSAQANDTKTWEEPADPAILSSELLCHFTRLPGREVPGFRLVDENPFDVAVEDLERNGVGVPTIDLAEVLDRRRRPSSIFAVPASLINRHVFVSGATGSGKSQTVRVILEGLTRNDIPWLVIEPAKSEYAGMADRVKGNGGSAAVTGVTIGEENQVPLRLNPLEPEPGFPPQTHADYVKALFVAAFEQVEPFPQILNLALQQVYRETGGLRARSGPTQWPSLSDLRRTALNIVEALGYQGEIVDNIRALVDVRLGSLASGSSGSLFELGHDLDFATLLRSNVTLELERIGDDQDKAFVTGAILLRTYEHLWVRGPSDRLEHVTVVEEAHRLLRKQEGGGSAAHAVDVFANLLAEMRSYGEGIIIAEQIPTKIVADVLKNTAVLIMHRLPAEEDRRFVGSAMNLSDEQSRSVPGLSPGEAVLFAPGMDRPVLGRMPLRRASEGRKSLQNSRSLVGKKRTWGAACPAGCSAEPCTLGAILDAQDLLEGVPQFELWIDLNVLACFAGINLITPDPAWSSPIFLQTGRRVLECAVACAVHRSLAARGQLHRTGGESGQSLGHWLSDALRLRTNDTNELLSADQWRLGPFDGIDWSADDLARLVAGNLTASGTRHLDELAARLSGPTSFEAAVHGTVDDAAVADSLVTIRNVAVRLIEE